jgi:hypothetical protein
MPGQELPLMELRDADVDFSGKPSNRTAARVQPDCLLSVGAQRLAAVLGDEWDNGVSVTVQGSPAFWVEDTGVLQTADLEIDVRVSQIVRLETDDDELAPSVPTFRIGLVRLNQIAVKLRSGPGPGPAPTLPAGSHDDAPRRFLTYLRPQGFRLSKSRVLAFLLIVTPVVLAASAWQFHARKAADSQIASDTAGSLARPVESGLSIADLQLPGVEPFLNSGIAKRLQLTQPQTEAFGRLNKTTQDALEDLEQYWQGPGRLELEGRREVILKAARQEALQLLSNEQRQKWEVMAAEASGMGQRGTR